jgi:hypothetical protein
METDQKELELRRNSKAGFAALPVVERFILRSMLRTDCVDVCMHQMMRDSGICICVTRYQISSVTHVIHRPSLSEWIKQSMAFRERKNT